MTLEQAIETAENYNRWRRGANDLNQPNPKTVGEALDKLITFAKINQVKWLN